jgi:epoxyqueuosine reductase QueG
VLTEAEFPVYPKMQEFSCGKCRACIDACPARAIADEPENFNHKGCYSKIREMTKERGIPQYICGICIKVCHPDGRTKET